MIARGLSGLVLALAGALLAACAGRLPDPPLARQPIPQEVSFRSAEVALSGTLHLPAGSGPHPALVVLHASGGPTRDYGAYGHLARELPANGIAVLLFDRRGSGRSGGDFATASFGQLAADGVAAVEHLRARGDIDPSRVGVWGVSQGGWLALLAAASSPHVAFAVAVSAPGVTPAAQMDYAAGRALREIPLPEATIAKALEARSVVNEYVRGKVERESAVRAVEAIDREPWFPSAMLPGGRDLPADPSRSKWRLEMDYDPLPALRKVDVPALLLFAEDDPWVPIEASMAAVAPIAAGKAAMTVRRVPGTGHYMEKARSPDPGDTSEGYAALLVEWLRKATTRQTGSRPDAPSSPTR
ncbi:MAG: alpha/beta fold hydrolase [Burkholderiales bacterium]|nr:alpha/beta fold hydrolase [Burkholderiales bacterium]